VPPGRLHSCTGLLYRSHRFALLADARSVLQSTPRIIQISLGPFRSLVQRDFPRFYSLPRSLLSTSRFQDTNIGHSASQSRLNALAAKRLALVCKLPLIGDEQVRPFDLWANQSPLAAVLLARFPRTLEYPRLLLGSLGLLGRRTLLKVLPF